MNGQNALRQTLTFIEGDEKLRTMPAHLVEQIKKNCLLHDSPDPSCADMEWKDKSVTVTHHQGKYAPYVKSGSNEVLLSARYRYGSDRQIIVVQHASWSEARIIVYEFTHNMSADPSVRRMRLRYRVWEETWGRKEDVSGKDTPVVEKACDDSVLEPQRQKPAENQFSFGGMQQQGTAGDAVFVVPKLEHRPHANLFHKLRDASQRQTGSLLRKRKVEDGRQMTSFGATPELDDVARMQMLSDNEATVTPEIKRARCNPTRSVCERTASPSTQNHVMSPPSGQKADVFSAQDTEGAVSSRSSPTDEITSMFIFLKRPDDPDPRKVKLKDCNTARKLFANLYAHKGATRETLVLEARIDGAAESMLLMRNSQADFAELLDALRTNTQTSGRDVEVVITGVNLDD